MTLPRTASKTIDLILVLLAVFAVAGCAKSVDPNDVAANIAISETSADDFVPSPWEEYLGITPVDLGRQVDEIKKCMKKRGFDYVVPSKFLPDPETDDQVGYGAASALLYAQPEVLSETEKQPEYQEALYTRTDDDGNTVTVGCEEIGIRSAAPQPQNLPDDHERLIIDLNDRIKADPAYNLAHDLWQRCAANAGYDYPSPQAVLTDVFGRAHQAASGLGTMTLEQAERWEAQLHQALSPCDVALTKRITSLRHRYESELIDELNSDS